MNTNRVPKAAFLALLALMLAGFSSMAQTFLTNDIINMFDNGGLTNDFAGSGSVASWLYWYNSPGGNLAMTNDVDVDAGGNPNSGSLMVVSPLAGYTQNQYFGTFNNGGQYDLRTEEANLLNYTSVSFDILFASNTPLSGSGNLGSITVLAVSQTGPPSYSVSTVNLTNNMVIPAQAETNWVHMVVPIDHTLPNLTAVGGIGFNYNSYGGYPLFTVTNWIDNLIVHSGAPPPPPPTLSSLVPSVSGLHCIATTGGAGGAGNRYHVCTVNDTGYTFYGQSSVTYSWNVEAFPPNTDYSFQQHIFLVNGAPGPYDQAADYNLADCIFMTIQADTAGVAHFSFRYKTNEPGGNGMLFNTLSLTNAANSNGWPVMPVCTLADPSGVVGNWSVTFDDSTNVTITGPGGLSTNFVFDPASAALFADPMTICVGAQPNDSTGGQEVVYGSFSATGCVSPINDNFSADASLDTTTWKNISNDTNGCVLAPAGTAYFLTWSLPDVGFSLQTAANLVPGATPWTGLSIGEIQDNGKRAVFLNSTNLPGTNSGYFSLVQRVFTQLQVLLPGETAAPGTPTGKTGTPAPQSTSTPVSITVNAVDANWNPISGVTDAVQITSSDPAFVAPLNAAMVNGTITLQGQFGTVGNWTITGTDVTQTNILSNTSSLVSVPD